MFANPERSQLLPTAVPTIFPQQKDTSHVRSSDLKETGNELHILSGAYLFTYLISRVSIYNYYRQVFLD